MTDDLAVKWKAPHVLHEFDGGYQLIYVDHPDDLATLGTIQGHCAGTHFVWACEERIWYFFTVVDKNGVPHNTVHAKQMKWVNKIHPRDNKPRPPLQLSHSYDRDTGRLVYPTLKSCTAAYKKASLEYKPGEWCALQYDSRAYDSQYQGAPRKVGFEERWGKDRVQACPAGVSKETWDTFAIARKAMHDEWSESANSAIVSGRTFKFDNKELVVLSHSGKGQHDGGQAYASMFAQWLKDENARASAAKKAARKETKNGTAVEVLA